MLPAKKLAHTKTNTEAFSVTFSFSSPKHQSLFGSFLRFVILGTKDQRELLGSLACTLSLSLSHRPQQRRRQQPHSTTPMPARALRHSGSRGEHTLPFGGRREDTAAGPSADKRQDMPRATAVGLTSARRREQSSPLDIFRQSGGFRSLKNGHLFGS